MLSDDWNGPWVQVDGDAEVLHMPEALDGLVDYFRCISGEHPDWDEYREAMRIQDKSLIRITPTRWGPIATGGFPADVAARLDGLISPNVHAGMKNGGHRAQSPSPSLTPAGACSPAEAAASQARRGAD